MLLMNRKWGLAIGVVFSLPFSANAATDCYDHFPQCSLTASRIQESGGRLTDISDTWETGWYDGFVMGIASPSLQKVWCPTRPFTGLQLSAVVSKYVKEHPEQWSENPQVLVSRALQQAFPCKK